MRCFSAGAGHGDAQIADDRGGWTNAFLAQDVVPILFDELGVE